MKALFGTLLTSALLVGLAYSLHCYTCKNERTNDNCVLATMVCPDSNYCQTTVIKEKEKVNISKTCVADCTLSKPLVMFECCQSDRCNVNGVNGVQASTVLLSVTMAASALLLRAAL